MTDAEKKARQLSRLYYNQGLECAGIRDLSGAIDKLQISLQFDKMNTQARNLLGLVYFETGEAVSALCQWIVSKNLQPDDNLADYYIQKVRSDQNRLHTINQTIRRYNTALENCRDGNDDAAAIQLRRALFQNSKLLVAYHLLALIELRNGRPVRAKRVLRRALRIDRTNATTLRYIKEADELSRKADPEKDAEERRREAETTGSPAANGAGKGSGHSSAAIKNPFVSNFVNILFGAGIGILAAWFIVAPAVRRSVSERTNGTIVNYTNEISSQEAQIEQLKEQVKSSSESAESAKNESDTTKSANDSYTNLLKAYQAYQSDDYETAGEALSNVDRSLLDSDSQAIYDEVSGTVSSTNYNTYVQDGQNAYYLKNYSEAADYLQKAADISSDDPDIVQLLALAYQNSGDTDKAIEIYNKIIELFPDTNYAANAEYVIGQLGGTTDSSDTQNTAG